MNTSLNCTAKFLARDKSTSISLEHLFGAHALNHLEAGEKARLEAVHWSARTAVKGSIIIDQGANREAVFVLLSGWAFRFQTLPDGKRQILDFIFAGCLVGFGCGTTNSYGVEAVTDCKIASVSYAQFRRLLSVCPSLAIHVAERVSDSEMRAHDHITSLGRRSARERIAGFIVELASKTPKAAAEGARRSFELPVTQIMIGDALGLSNEHVCRVLGKLANDGVLRFDRHMLEVLDEAALVREAGMNDDEYPSHRRMVALAA
jgi:CRP/FNR family transcriptional regulator, anaerobic regulatory protein